MLLVFFYHHAYALYISADISSMESGNPSFLSPILMILKTNLYTFSVYQIDRPGYQEQGTPIQNGEILFTPLKKFYYPGAGILKFSIEERRMRKNVIIKLLLVKRHLI